MVSEDFLKKAGLQIGLAFLFTVIYGIGALLASPLISTILGGTTGIWIGNALFVTLLGYGYVKILRSQSFRQKILAAIIGSTVISVFSGISKIMIDSLTSLSQSFSSTQANLPSSQTNQAAISNLESPIDPLMFFTVHLIFFNLPFIYLIKQNKQLPELDSRDILIAAGYLIPLAVYYFLPKLFGAR